MKALSVCQPWAWAILHGGKAIENRSRRTHYRGPLVLHASKSRRNVGGDFTRLLPGLPPWEQLPYGALVGVVELVDCVPVHEVADDSFAEEPWCWVLARPRVIDPVSFRGQVGWFNVPDDLIGPRIDRGATVHESKATSGSDGRRSRRPS
jgi:hypothetical protein